MFLARLFRTLYPSRCVGCDRAGAIFCPACRPHPSAVRDRRAGDLVVSAAGRYAGVLRRAILLYKRGRRDAGDELAALAAERLGARVASGVLLVPVPTTGRRRRKRGFDQGVRLARGIGSRLDRPVLLALAQVAGDEQRGRSRRARLDARNRFRCVAPHLLAGARIVLIDDVMTTGATLRDCAATLERGGALVVGALVLAHA